MVYIYAIAFLLCRVVLADVVDMSASASWSIASTGVVGYASGTGSTPMTFNVNLPANAVISAATLNLSQLSTLSFYSVFQESDCLPPSASVQNLVGQVTGCSDVPARNSNLSYPDALFDDTVNFSVNGPGVSTNPSSVFPLSIDPNAIPTNGTYSISIGGQASEIFFAWLYPQQSIPQGTMPPIPFFSTSSNATGMLQIVYDIVPTPEPAAFGLVLGGSIIFAGFLVRRRLSDVSR